MRSGLCGLLLMFGTVPCVFALGPPIKLKPGAFSKNVSINGKPDTLKLRLTFLFKNNTLPPAGLHLTLYEITTPSHIQPQLLDSIPFPEDKKAKASDSTRQIRVVLSPLKCLAANETFKIRFTGTDSALTYSFYTVTINATTDSKTLITATPTVAMAGDTSVLLPLVKGSAASALQVISPGLLLSGTAAHDMPADLVIPRFMFDAAPSRPAFYPDSTVNIPRGKFSGCPTVYHAPIMIKLTPVDTPSNEQLFYIEVKNEQGSASLAIIPASGAAKTAGTAGKKEEAAPAKSDPYYSFTFACGGKVYQVLLDPDTTTMVKSVRVVIDKNKDPLLYQFQNVYDGANLASFLVTAGKLSADCAGYISFRIGNELAAMKPGPAASAPETGDAAAAPAKTPTTPPPPTKPKTPAANAPKGAATATPGKSADKSTPSKSGSTKTDPGANSDPATGSNTISLDDAVTTINPYYTKKDTAQILSIDFYVVRDSMPTQDDTVGFHLDPYRFPKPKSSKRSFALTTVDGKDKISAVVIPRSSWFDDTSSGKWEAPVRLYLTNPPVDSIRDDDAFANIKLDDGDTSYHAIRLTEKGMYNRIYPFWVDLGTNFDLLNGIQANNLYAGVYGYVKDVARIGGSGRNNLSILAGVYEGKSISTGSSSDSGLVYRDGTSYIPSASNNNMFPYYQDTGTIKNTVSITSMGIFLSPQLRLTTGPAEDFGLHMFVSFYTEVLWQKVNNSFDYSGTNRAQTLYADTPALYHYPFKENSLSADYRSHYVGFGMPLLIRNKIFTLYVAPTFGWTNQRFVLVADNWSTSGAYKKQGNYLANSGGFAQPACTWNPFYLITFRLNEEKYGISVTGEVRSILLRDSKSAITISLSKKFDLSDLFNTIVKPFTPGSAATSSPD